MSSFPSRSRFPREVVGFPSPSSATNSAGAIRNRASASASSVSHASWKNSPVVASSAAQANGATNRTAARKLFPRASRHSSLKTSPGVTTSVTSRRKIPFWPGSSICSQMATLHPCRISFDR